MLNELNAAERTTATQSALILLLTKRDIDWVMNSLEALAEVLSVDDFQQVAKTLNNIRCDLLIIDAETFADEALDMIRELKRNFRHFPVGVLSERIDDSTRSLLTVGVDLSLVPELSTEEIQQQIRIILRQNISYRAVVSRNEKYYVVSSLPTLLRDFVNTKQILLQAVKVMINLLNLTAVTITINDDHFYISSIVRRPLVTANLPIDTVELREDNPILWSMRNRKVQVYDDVSLNPHFVLSEGVNDNTSAVIVPFTYPENQQGALTFFLPNKTLVPNEEIFIYEQFAIQLESILLRAYQNELQTRQVALSKRLVEAWSLFAAPQNVNEALHLLAAIISGVNKVENVLVSYKNSQTREDLLFDSRNDDLTNSLNESHLLPILEDFQSALKPVSQARLLNVEELKPNQARLLTDLFATDHFVLLPIVISNDALGLILIAISRDYRLDMLEVHLVENITRIAGNALQRITLRSIVARNQIELMSILSSIGEGIFYVNEDQKVTFCNPQLTELTSVTVEDRINQDVDRLLQAIAMASCFPSYIYRQLQTARRQMMVSNLDHDYPIVTIPIAEQNIELNIEFIGIDQNSDHPIWMGVVHQDQRSRSAFTLALEPLVRNMREAHMRLRSAFETLDEKNGHYSHNSYAELLEKIRVGATNVSNHWEQFDSFYTNYLTDASLQFEPIGIRSLLELALKVDRLSGETSRIKFPELFPSVSIQVNEFHFARALSKVFAHLLGTTPLALPIEVRLEEQSESVNILVSSVHAQNAFAELEEILVMNTDQSSEKQTNFDLIGAIEFINRSGAQVSIQRSDFATRFLRISIPLVSVRSQWAETAGLGLEVVVPDLEEAPKTLPEQRVLSILIVEGQSAFSLRAKNLLEAEGFNLQSCQTGETAMLNLLTALPDLIVLDLNLEDENSLTVCQRLRNQWAIPILMVADYATAQTKALCTQSGADDLVTVATPEREFLASIRGLVADRKHRSAPNAIHVGDLFVDFDRRAVFLRNELINLSPIQYRVLYCLISNQGQIVKHKQLLSEVWGPGYENELQYLWVSISRLRKKLELNPNSPRYIRTQSGVGYYFTES